MTTYPKMNREIVGLLRSGGDAAAPQELYAAAADLEKSISGLSGVEDVTSDVAVTTTGSRTTVDG